MGQESSQIEIGDSQAIGSQRAVREESAAAETLFNRVASSQPEHEADKPKVNEESPAVNGNNMKLSRKQQKAQRARAAAEQQRTSQRRKQKGAGEFKATELTEIPETQQDEQAAVDEVEAGQKSTKADGAVGRSRRNTKVAASVPEASQPDDTINEADGEPFAASGRDDQPKRTRGRKAKKTPQKPDEQVESNEPSAALKMEPVTPRRSNRRNTRANNASPEVEPNAEVIPESSLPALITPARSSKRKMKTFSAKNKTVAPPQVAPIPDEIRATPQPEVQVPNSWEANEVPMVEAANASLEGMPQTEPEETEQATTPGKKKRRLPVHDDVDTPTKRARKLITAPVDDDANIEEQPEIGQEPEPETEPKAQPKTKRRTSKRKSKTAVADAVPDENIMEAIEPPGNASFEESIANLERSISAGADAEPGKPKNYLLGQITDDEWEAVERVLEVFRDMHGLTEAQQIELIQGPQSKNSVSYEMFDAICNELPNRKRWSVIRACRRRFHGYAARGKWTAEDDADLKRYQALYPNQWKKIGETIHRLPEDCRDRWRNYLVCGDNMVRKRWRPDEEIRLKTIVENSLEEIREAKKKNGQENGVGEEVGDDTMMLAELLDWQKISERLGHTRNRRQCIDKWKLLAKRENEKWDEQRESFRLTLVHAAQMTLENKLELLHALEKTQAKSEAEVHWGRLGTDLFRSKFSTDARKLAWARLKSTVDDAANLEFTDLLKFLVLKLEQCDGFDPTIDAFNEDVDEEAIYADLNDFGRMMREQGTDGKYSVGQKQALMLIGTMSLEDKLKLLRFLRDLHPMVEKEEYVKWPELGDADFKKRWNGYCKKAAWERLKGMIVDNHKHEFKELVDYLLRQMSKFLKTGHDKTRALFRKDINRWSSDGTPRKSRLPPNSLRERIEHSTPSRDKVARRKAYASRLSQVHTEDGDEEDASQMDASDFDPVGDGASASTPAPANLKHNGLSEAQIFDSDEEADEASGSTSRFSIEIPERQASEEAVEDDDLDNITGEVSRNGASDRQDSEEADEATELMPMEVVQPPASTAGFGDLDMLDDEVSDQQQVEEPSIFGPSRDASPEDVLPEKKEKKKGKKKRSSMAAEESMFDGIDANGAPVMKATQESIATEEQPSQLDATFESSQIVSSTQDKKKTKKRRKSRESILEEAIAMSQEPEDAPMADAPPSAQPEPPSSPPAQQDEAEEEEEEEEVDETMADTTMADTTMGDDTMGDETMLSEDLQRAFLAIEQNGEERVETKEERKERRRLKKERKARKAERKEKRAREREGEGEREESVVL